VKLFPKKRCEIYIFAKLQPQLLLQLKYPLLNKPFQTKKMFSIKGIIFCLAILTWTATCNPSNCIKEIQKAKNIMFALSGNAFVEDIFGVSTALEHLNRSADKINQNCKNIHINSDQSFIVSKLTDCSAVLDTILDLLNDREYFKSDVNRLIGTVEILLKMRGILSSQCPISKQIHKKEFEYAFDDYDSDISIF